MINTHEKFLKQHLDNIHEILIGKGYVGNKDVVYAHFLEVVVDTDAFIRSGQSTKNPMEEITEEEYFKLIISRMNSMLASEHGFEHNIDNSFTMREKEQLISDLKQGVDVSSYANAFFIFPALGESNFKEEQEQDNEDEWDLEV